jgi:hypothetical protein
LHVVAGGVLFPGDDTGVRDADKFSVWQIQKNVANSKRFTKQRC